MGKRNLNVGRSAQCSRDSGYDFHMDSRLTQSLQLFAAATKDEGVSALQPDYLQPHQRVLR